MIKEIFLIAAMSFTPNVHMPQEYAEMIWEETRETDVDPVRVAALMYTESRFNRRAFNRTSRTRGLMQIAPFWIRHFHLRPNQLFNPRINIRSGIRILEIGETAHHERCPRSYGRNYNRHHQSLAHYRCHRDSLRTRACRRSLRSVHRWEERFRDRVTEIERESAEQDNGASEEN